MNKVVTIHLDGIAYQLEEGAYDALRAYLDAANAKLAQNPDKDEIVKDLEQAIGAKLSTYLSAHKNVVTSEDVGEVLAEMGPVAAEGEEDFTGGNAAKASGAATHKRLYRIREGGWIAGVCNGLAAYFNVDVNLVRILFVLLGILTHGFAVALYVIMIFIVPVARTQKEYETAGGMPPVTAQELVDRARKGIEDFASSNEWKNWQYNWKDQQRAWKHQRKAWKRAQKMQWKVEHGPLRYEHRSSAVSELFGIACATLAISFTLWFLYGHVTLFHDFFNALHRAYESFIASLAQLIDSPNR